MPSRRRDRTANWYRHKNKGLLSRHSWQETLRLLCKKCQVRATPKVIRQQTKAGMRLRASCWNCGAFLKWLPRDEM